MSYIKINGRSFDADVAIGDYEENFNVLDGPNAGRGTNGKMIRDVVGMYLGHKITVHPRGMDHKGIDDYWEFIKLHSVDDSVMLEAADSQTTIRYEAYYTSGARKLMSAQNGTRYWGEVSVNFIPISATLEP